MAKLNLDKVSGENIVNGIKKYQLTILTIVTFIITTGLLVIGSMGIELRFSMASIISILTAFIIFSVWYMYHKENYEEILAKDDNTEIQKEYYEVVKKWNPLELQNQIKQFNKKHKEQWDEEKKDRLSWCETEKQRKKILKEKYRGSGIISARQLSSIFYVSLANGNTYNTNGDITFLKTKAITRIAMTLSIISVGASFFMNGTSNGWWSAFLNIFINIITLTFAILSGISVGVQRGKLKMIIGEDILNLLKQWLNEEEVRQESVKLESQQTVSIIMDTLWFSNFTKKEPVKIQELEVI
jgi:hypothetical protein